MLNTTSRLCAIWPVDTFHQFFFFSSSSFTSSLTPTDLPDYSATLLLAHAKTQTLNQKRLENYLAASSTPNLDISQRLDASRSSSVSFRTRRSPSKGASGADTPRDLNARVKILELYTLHVLVRNNEWDYAREFISMSSVLDEERRDAFLQALQSLQDEKLESEREKQRQDEQLQKDMENARKLRAENEAKERRRIEEERERREREGSEVDYGVERTPSSAGTSRPRPKPPTSASSSAVSRPPKSSAAKARGGKKKAVAAPPGIGARAATILANLQNGLGQMSATLRGNPMLLLRLLAFVISILIVLGKRDIREHVRRVLATGWNKVGVYLSSARIHRSSLPLPHLHLVSFVLFGFFVSLVVFGCSGFIASRTCITK